MQTNIQPKPLTQRSAFKPIVFGLLAAIVEAIIAFASDGEAIPGWLAPYIPIIVAALRFILVELRKPSVPIQQAQQASIDAYARGVQAQKRDGTS